MTSDPPESGWYPVSGLRDLPPGFARAVTLFGEDIALWRSEDGHLHAWQNRCLHRGMRLSLGFVRGEQLVCRYHGWHYDGTGACGLIPAHPRQRPPENLRVRGYACVEESELLWLRLDEADEIPPNLSAVSGQTPAFCQSFRFRLGLDALADRLSRTPFPTAKMAGRLDWRYEPTETAPGAMTALWRTSQSDSPRELRYHVQRPNRGLVTVTASDDGGPLETRLSALQPIDDKRTALHLLVSSPSGDSLGARRVAAQWGRQLRVTLEPAGVDA